MISLIPLPVFVYLYYILVRLKPIVQSISNIIKFQAARYMQLLIQLPSSTTVTAHSPQGPNALDRAIRGLSMHEGRVQLVWMQRIEGSDYGPWVS